MVERSAGKMLTPTGEPLVGSPFGPNVETVFGFAG